MAKFALDLKLKWTQKTISSWIPRLGEGDRNTVWVVREKLPSPPFHATQEYVPKFFLGMFNYSSNVNNRQLSESFELKHKLSGLGPISFMDSLLRFSVSTVCLPVVPLPGWHGPNWEGTQELLLSCEHFFTSTQGHINMHKPIKSPLTCKQRGSVCWHCSRLCAVS